MNEEDLLELKDSYADIQLKPFVVDFLNNFIIKEREYFFSILKYLLKEDQEYAKLYLNLHPKSHS
jgi:hypothetical protein